MALLANLMRISAIHDAFAVLQLYMYTFSGLQDKKGNHLTQFMGFLVRPVAD